MASGGADRSHLKPLDPDGNLYSDRVGCHRGDWEHMNVRNPQPGFTYYYERPHNIRRRIAQGYKVVGADDPEFKGMAADPNFQAAGIDSAELFRGLVLMKCPEQRVRQRAAERIARNKADLTGATHDYLAGGSSDERRYGAPDRPIRFKLPRHGISDITGPDRDRADWDKE